MYQTLKKLLPARPSVSGREETIRERIAAEMKPFADSVKTDAMGNLICLRRGNGAHPRRVALIAHMDEIGFMVERIEQNGFLRVAAVGGIDAVAAAGNPVVFENGVRGVLVTMGNGENGKEAPKVKDFAADIGARDKKAAERRVKIGDCCAIPASLTRLSGTVVCGRPLDDRVGCAVLLRVAAALISPADDVYFVFSVQEEVGCRGAAPAAFTLRPDVALVFDVTGTGDTIGADRMAVKLGGGAAIKIKDASVICHAGLVEELLAAGKAAGVPTQCEILPYGGTDTSAVQMAGAGCRAGAISVPCRYIHTAVETVDLKDAEAAVALTLAYLGSGKE